MTVDVIDVVRRQATTVGEDPAVVTVGPRATLEVLSWQRLLEQADELASALRVAGTRPGDGVIVARPPGAGHAIATLAGWLAGAIVLPIRPQLSDSQRDAIGRAFDARIVFDTETFVRRTTLAESHEGRIGNIAEPREDIRRWRCRSAFLSGGTTGDPKLLYRRRPWTVPSAEGKFAVLSRPGDRRLVATGLDGMGFQALWDSVLLGNTTIVLERFAPALWLRTVASHNVSTAWLVPTQLKWIAEAADFMTTDLSSLRVLLHSAAACPDEVKQRWIDRLSPDRVYESYSSREDLLSTLISGDEWLSHRGSVGNVDPRTVQVLDEEQEPVPIGEVGRIYLRPHDDEFEDQAYGPRIKLRRHGKLVTLGDLGRLDEDGYLYLVDRETEMFTTGGHNVFPQGVESQMLECAVVRDIVVLGEPDADLGHIAVAFVALHPHATLKDVEAFARRKLSGPDLPREFRLVAQIPRDANGKVPRRLVGALFSREALDDSISQSDEIR